MKKAFKVEFTLSGDLAELYAVTIAERGEGISLEQMNRSLVVAGVLQHLSALIVQGYFDELKASRLKEIMNRVLQKALGKGVIPDAIELFGKHAPDRDSDKDRRESLLKGLERLEQMIKNKDLPPEILINEASILKKKLDKFVYGLGA
ncbi:MAG TPA: hypothetical protein EYP53_09100 [Candidatus Latescibacteria bacterium]|nr:hypothetical protein [Candidatus Latescibacterota bacterium]